MPFHSMIGSAIPYIISVVIYLNELFISYYVKLTEHHTNRMKRKGCLFNDCLMTWSVGKVSVRWTNIVIFMNFSL